jgi:hypothetical protein
MESRYERSAMTATPFGTLIWQLALGSPPPPRRHLRGGDDLAGGAGGSVFSGLTAPASGTGDII